MISQLRITTESALSDTYNISMHPSPQSSGAFYQTLQPVLSATHDWHQTLNGGS